MKPEPVDDAVEFDHHEGATPPPPLVHHGAPLAFSLAALRERRAGVKKNRRGCGPTDPLGGDREGRGEATRPDEIIADSSSKYASKYAAASFGVERGPNDAEIVADEDGGDRAVTHREARREGMSKRSKTVKNDRATAMMRARRMAWAPR